MNGDAKEFYDERAAILEFDAGLSRGEAERIALIETKEHIFRCMVRQLLIWNAAGRRQDVVAWLDKTDVDGKRDPVERKVYADAVNEQWKAGNRGEAGDWKLNLNGEV